MTDEKPRVVLEEMFWWLRVFDHKISELPEPEKPKCLTKEQWDKIIAEVHEESYKDGSKIPLEDRQRDCLKKTEFLRNIEKYA
jgi:hypothetical protein